MKSFILSFAATSHFFLALGAPEQTRVGLQKAFEHSDLVLNRTPAREPEANSKRIFSRFAANIFHGAARGIKSKSRNRSRSPAKPSHALSGASARWGSAVAMISSWTAAASSAFRKSVAKKQFRAVPDVSRGRNAFHRPALRRIDGVVPKHGRRDQRRPGGQRLKPVQLLQQFRDMLPCVIGAMGLAIAAAARVER